MLVVTIGGRALGRSWHGYAVSPFFAVGDGWHRTRSFAGSRILFRALGAGRFPPRVLRHPRSRLGNGVLHHALGVCRDAGFRGVKMVDCRLDCVVFQKIGTEKAPCPSSLASCPAIIFRGRDLPNGRSSLRCPTRRSPSRGTGNRRRCCPRDIQTCAHGRSGRGQRCGGS